MPSNGYVRAKTVARRKGIKDLYQQDWSVTKMAKHFGVSCPTIYKDLRILGLKSRGHVESDGHNLKKAMSQAAKIRAVQDRIDENSTPMCCKCAKPAMKKPYRKEFYCGDCLQTAGDHDPNYEKKRRQDSCGRFTSHGRTE